MDRLIGIKSRIFMGDPVKTLQGGLTGLYKNRAYHQQAAMPVGINVYYFFD
jgi:hypothetical protein